MGGELEGYKIPLGVNPGDFVEPKDEKPKVKQKKPVVKPKKQPKEKEKKD